MSKSGAVNLPAFKTSIKKSANKAIARTSATRSSINTASEASPQLRGTKRRSKEDPRNPPAIKKMATNQDLAAALSGITNRLDKIDEGLRSNASKEDVTQVQNALSGLRAQVSSNKENIEWLMRNKDEDSRRQRESLIKDVRGEVEKKLNEFSASPWQCGSEVREVLKLEEVEYNHARRSMRMWPVPEGDETAEKAARDFMTNVLEVPRITVSRIRIEFVRRVSATRRSRMEDEVLVRFMDVGDRDAVQSYAPNLAKWAGKAGISCLLYTSPSPRDRQKSRMPSSA